MCMLISVILLFARSSGFVDSVRGNEAAIWLCIECLMIRGLAYVIIKVSSDNCNNHIDESCNSNV